MNNLQFDKVIASVNSAGAVILSGYDLSRDDARDLLKTAESLIEHVRHQSELITHLSELFLMDRLSTLQKADRAAQSSAGMDILPEVWQPCGRSE